MLLDQMRKHSRSFIIYIFFGIIIAVFVVNFGPQSQGCVAGTTYAGNIAGNRMTLNDFNYAMSVSGLKGRAVDQGQMAQLKSYVMDQFIARELFAREGRRLGLGIGNKAIDDMLLRGDYIALGMRRKLMRGENGKFDYDLFSRYVRFNWGITVKKFKAQQRRELMAERYRQIIRNAVKVSEAEVLADFEHRSSRAKLAYVRFAPAEFRDQVSTGKEKIAAFIKANKDKIKKHYETNKTAYTKLPEQARLRVIKVAYAEGNAQADPDGKAEAPTGKAKVEARAKAKSLKARVSAGEAFAKVAADASDHPSKSRGGLLGWRNAAKPGLGEAVKKALASLKESSTSDVIEGAKGFWLIKVEARRKGDLSLEQASPEIAEQMIRDEEAKAMAKAAAKEYIKRAKAGEKLEAIFSTEDDDEEAKKSPHKLRTTAFFPRSPHNLVPGIGISSELMNAAFTLEPGSVADEPFTVGQMIYLVSVEERKDPDLETWAKRKDDLVEGFQARKAELAVRRVAFDLCSNAKHSGELRVHSAILAPPTPPGVKPTQQQVPAYTPCKSLDPNSLPLGRM